MTERLAHLAWIALFAAYLLVRGARWWLLGLEPEGAAVLAGALLLPFDRTRRLGALVALAAYGRRLAGALLLAPNHELVEAALLALVASFGAARDSAARGALRRAVGAVALGVIVWSGVQKVAHGFYTAGDYFAVSYAMPSKFGEALDRLTTGAERAEARAFRAALLARLARGEPGPIEAAPPRPDIVSRASALACAATLAAELVLPLFLIPRRTRRWAVSELALFFVAVEAVAHEWMFAALLVVLLLPFALPAGPPRARGEPALGPGRARPHAIALALLLAWPAAHIVLARELDLSPWRLGGFGMYAAPPRDGALFIETRAPADPNWRAWAPADPAEARFLYRRDAILRTAPFALGAARELAAHARAAAGPGAVAAVRVRSVDVRWDRAAGRFRVEERVYVFGPGGAVL